MNLKRARGSTTRVAVVLSTVVLTIAGGASRGDSLRADSIELLSGQRVDNIQILSAKWEGIQYKLSGAPQAQNAAGPQVLSITRDSTLLQGARAAIESGSTAKALKDLEAIVSAAAAPGKNDDWEKAEAMYLIGRAHRNAGDLKAAIAAYQAYLDKQTGAKDWYLPHATYDLAETQLLDKQPGTAEVTFKKLTSFGGQWVLRSKLGEAMSSLAAKGAADATKIRSLCDEVIKSRDAPAQLRNQALVIRAKALLAQKNPKQAIDELTSGFFSNSKGDVEYSAERAEATLIMGKAYLLLEGKENQDWAEIWLLRVPALYTRYSSAYQEACDLLSAFYEKAGKADRAADWKARKQSGGAARAPQASAAAPTPAPAAPAAEPTSKKEAAPAPKGGNAKGAGSKGKK